MSILTVKPAKYPSIGNISISILWLSICMAETATKWFNLTEQASDFYHPW